ncbi:MAG: regulatory protein RecX [Parachlamydiaceae bacterium]|nr:regulatory protein RecX [Parachlamydiaceae bacterium]
MKIAYSPKIDRRGILTISVDGEPWGEIHTMIFGKRPSFPTCNSLEEFEQAFRAVEYRAALNYALRRLSVRSLSSNEMRKSLVERLVSPDTISKVIQECMQNGYLNDEVWLDAFVRGLLSKKLGPRAMMYKLRLKGVSQSDAERILESSDNPEACQERIAKLVATRYRTRDLTDYHEREKVIAALMRKGFNLDDVQAVLKK